MKDPRQGQSVPPGQRGQEIVVEEATDRLAESCRWVGVCLAPGSDGTAGRKGVPGAETRNEQRYRDVRYYRTLGDPWVRMDMGEREIQCQLKQVSEDIGHDEVRNSGGGINPEPKRGHLSFEKRGKSSSRGFKSCHIGKMR